MSTQDAYAPPQSTVRDVSGGTGLMTDSIVNSLRKTRPWVLLLAIMGFIGTAFILIAAIGMALGGDMLMQGMQDGGGLPGGFVYGAVALYLVLGIIYFMASWYLLKYAGAIKRAVTGMNLEDLEIALAKQASFWKLMGILTLISIIAVIGMMALSIGSAMFMGGSM